MVLRFFNALNGRLEEFRPKNPPFIRVMGVGQDCPGARGRTLSSCLARALVYLGYSLSTASGAAPELYFGPDLPPPGTRCWLKLNGEIDGFQDEAERLFYLNIHYRKPLEFSAQDLESCRQELTRFRDTAHHLASAYGSSAFNPTALAGYKKRFRDALSEDMNFPEAVATVEDALRPGALSPGSQLWVLREIDPIFELSLF